MGEAFLTSEYSEEDLLEEEEKDLLLVCPNVEIAYKWIGYFESINSKNVLYYPPTENLPYSSINKSKEIEYTQLTVISKLIKNERKNLNSSILKRERNRYKLRLIR